MFLHVSKALFHVFPISMRVAQMPEAWGLCHFRAAADEGVASSRGGRGSKYQASADIWMVQLQVKV